MRSLTDGQNHTSYRQGNEAWQGRGSAAPLRAGEKSPGRSGSEAAGFVRYTKLFVYCISRDALGYKEESLTQPGFLFFKAAFTVRYESSEAA